MYTRGSQLVYVAALHDITIPEYGRASQFICPFHKFGQEHRPSARFYPDTDSMHCFTCNRSWTPLQFHAEASDATIKEAALQLRAHGIKISPKTARLSEDPKKELDDLVILASIRFRAKPDTPARRKMYDIFDRIQALVLTGQGDAREGVAVIRSAIHEYEQGTLKT